MSKQVFLLHEAYNRYRGVRNLYIEEFYQKRVGQYKCKLEEYMKTMTSLGEEVLLVESMWSEPCYVTLEPEAARLLEVLHVQAAKADEAHEQSEDEPEHQHRAH